MATGKPLIFESVEILAAGASAGTGTTYGEIDSDNIAVGNEPLTTLIEDGQTLMDGFEQSMEIVTYDDAVGSDANANTDTTDNGEAQVILNGVTGSKDITIDNARVNVYRPFQDLNRDHFIIQVTRTSTTAITVADA